MDNKLELLKAELDVLNLIISAVDKIVSNLEKRG